MMERTRIVRVIIIEGFDSKGMIFEIVRNSFVDGLGIRTTVFFKGCNLKSVWFHNPESQSFDKQMMFYKNKCTGCGECMLQIDFLEKLLMKCKGHEIHTAVDTAGNVPFGYFKIFPGMY